MPVAAVAADGVVLPVPTNATVLAILDRIMRQIARRLANDATNGAHDESSRWRDTWLYPGESHVIHLIPPENSALIEGYDAAPGFSATVRNCTPQSIGP